MRYGFIGKVGFCIGQDIERPEAALMQKLAQYGTPALSDGLNRFSTMDPLIKPICDTTVIAGPAFTVRLRPGDNLMLHKAIEIAQQGDIIVVDTCGCTKYSILGDLMASSAFKKGIGGIVIDGSIRDIADLRERKFPIFAKHVTPCAGDKDGPGEINMPISCAGVPVLPGDYIVGDCNGVVVIRPELVEQVIKGTETKLEYERKRILEIEAGNIVKPDVDEKLRKLGVI